MVEDAFHEEDGRLLMWHQVDVAGHDPSERSCCGEVSRWIEAL
jgi:hypothetical protein